MTVHAYLNLYTMEQLADRCARLDGELAAEHALVEALKHSLGLAEDENAKLWESLEYANNEWEKESMEYLSTQAENAKLRKMLAEDNEELAKMRRVIDYLYPFAKTCGVDAGDMRELGIEVMQ